MSADRLDLRDAFYGLADELLAARAPGEEMRLCFDGERSDFVRFNKGAVRQPGTVEQRYLSVELIRGMRHTSARLALSGDREIDDPRVEDALARMRRQIESLPEDPHLLLPDDPRSVEEIGEDRLPAAEAVVDEVLGAGRGTDLVGIYAGGGIFGGFASSLGQKSWFSSHTFHLDFSLYLKADKAVKESYAGFAWDGAALEAKMAGAKEKLSVLDRPVKALTPGRYRVYLSPAALEEIFGLLSWNGFGLQSHRSKTTPLLRLAQGEVALSPAVTLLENTAEGVGPSFDGEGFVKPPAVPLIEAGRLAGTLVSPRSAREYGVPTNAASAGEQPQALDLAAGEIPDAEVLGRLGDGLYVGNLWYLNYSDPESCRITGMTRFATFWVEGGEVRAPTPVMRFDESVYRMFGENLEGLTQGRELVLDAGTYGARATRSARLPGALVRDFTLTL
jgi:predicted Zn-dependent protease